MFTSKQPYKTLASTPATEDHVVISFLNHGSNSAFSPIRMVPPSESVGGYGKLTYVTTPSLSGNI